MNAADEEDITSENGLLKLKNRSALNGMGYVILRKNKSFAEQVTKKNTIYEIRYGFDLNGETINLPNDIILDFCGGYLSNGSIIGGIMQENSQYVFRNVSAILSSNSVITPQNFGAKLDGKNDDTDALKVFFRCGYDSVCQMRAKGTAIVSDTITIPTSCCLPSLNIFANDIDKPIIYIDNYRYDRPLDKQNGEDMIRNKIIEIGKVINKSQHPSVDSVGIKVSACRDIKIICPRIEGCGAGLLLEGYDSQVGYVSYSEFNIKFILNCKSGIKMRQFSKSGDSSRVGWVTECSFYSPKISCPTDNLWDEVNFIDMQTDEGNTIDGHVFYHPCLEGATDTANTKRWAISLKHAILNTFICPRFEAVKAGAVRWLGSYTNNGYANTFIAGYGDYEYKTYEGIYKENSNRYIIIGTPMYSSIMKIASPIENPITYPIEKGEYSKLPKGLAQLPFVISEKPSNSNTNRGTGLAVIGNTNDWERGGNFMLWAPASSLNKLYFRKSKEVDDETGSNFGDWYEIQKRNINAIEKSDAYMIPQDSSKYEIFQQFIGYNGITTHMGNGVWINKRGFVGIMGGSPSQAPFGSGKYLNRGDSYMAQYDTKTFKPFFYIGNSETQAQNWITADGEFTDILKKGSTSDRPTPHHIGFLYFDTTLGNKPIWYIGSGKWVDANGNYV